MKKIILTEKQLQKVKNQLIMENVSDTYNRDVNVRIYAGRCTYKGMEINDIFPQSKMDISYAISIEGRSWGIKDISLYGIEGDNSIEIEISYYIDQDNTETDTISLPINWDLLETESNSGQGVITVGDSLEIYLKNDEEGNLMIRSMSMEVYTL